MSTAFIFPGQGSQAVGMSDALAAAFPEIRASYDEASEALGYDLWTLVQAGPEAELNATDRTQPAMLTAGIAVWRLWRDQGGCMPTVMAGHSLGEYTALVAAGSLELGTAVRLVRLRGELMQSAVPSGTGAMAAIIGLDDTAVITACADAAQGGVVEAVNFNAPGQVVIAGDTAAVARGIEACKAAGAKRAIELPVSVPSHCALMRPAAEALGAQLVDIELLAPKIPVLHNIDVDTHSDASGIREALTRQLHGPVRWVETIQAIAARGATRVIECGPGKVLAGLNRRIDRGLETHALVDPDTLAAALAAEDA